MCIMSLLTELIADPTKCRVMNDEDTFKLEDIARQSNGTSQLTLFGQSRSLSLYITFDNIDSSKYYQLSTKANISTMNYKGLTFNPNSYYEYRSRN